MTERTRLTSAKSRRNNHKEQLLTNDRRGELESVQSSRKNQYGDNKYGPKENVRIEVLEEKIKVDSKNHDKEKQKIMSEKDQEIRSLEAENECLKIEVAKKTDKIRQLSNANNKKEFLLEKREHDIKEMQKETEILKKREESLNMEIKRLENEHTHISEMYKETSSIVKNQQDKMKSMEKEISSLKEELEMIKAEKAEKEEQERKLRAQVTSMVEEIKAIHGETKLRDQERERKMEEKERKLEEKERKMEEREKKKEEEAAKRDKTMLEQMNKIYSAVTRSTTQIRNDIKMNSRANPNENLVITEARNFSIQNDNHYHHYGSRIFYRKRQSANNAKIQPLVECSFQNSMGINQNKRGGNPKDSY